jgi:hypothetical protein
MVSQERMSFISIGRGTIFSVFDCSGNENRIPEDHRSVRKTKRPTVKKQVFL